MVKKCLARTRGFGGGLCPGLDTDREHGERQQKGEKVAHIHYPVRWVATMVAFASGRRLSVRSVPGESTSIGFDTDQGRIKEETSHAIGVMLTAPREAQAPD
jgi:hypothetical protein